MGMLYIVGTPIGNLEDITLRALRVLGEVDVVLAEDTRVTKKLLLHFDLHTPTERFDAKIEHKQTEQVVERIRNGEIFALVTDAGTPGISDPGAHLVKKAHEAGLKVESIPGPSALATALSIAGMNDTEFIFLGFPPHKKGRKTFFEKIGTKRRMVVFYESTHRIKKALEALARAVPDRTVVLCRELTKLYEEVLEGTAQELLDIFEEYPEKQKGEFVVLVEGAQL
jgi:16S rRNA (cytidine1402-2'-O)-methyltransferase